MNAMNMNYNRHRKLEASPLNLIVRCLIEGHKDHWEAYTLEFGLAAQAESQQEAKEKLQAMVTTYLYDALVGEDQAHASELLARRARLGVYLKYYFTKYFGNIWRNDRNDQYGVYSRPVPLAPVGC